MVMYSTRYGEDDGTVSRPFRTSDRLKSRPKLYGRPYLYYTPTTIIRPKRRKTKTMTAASQIAKILHLSDRPLRTSNKNSVVTNLRRSKRKRRMSENQEVYTNSSGIDDNLCHKRRGSIVHSRPLSYVVAPCLQVQLQKAMSAVVDVFPPVSVSYEFAKLSMRLYGFAIPLVYRPRLLLCGGEGVGLDHIGPAILHELKNFPVHSLGLPSLLSHPGAKTPEEALVHIFSVARRTSPSILYLPQFHLWWENAHEQLRAVLLTLLEELPSDLPIFLFGTSSMLLDNLPGNPSLVFPPHNVLHLTTPSSKDRAQFFDCLIDAALSIESEDVTGKPSRMESLPELPKAPNVASGPNISELKAKAETQGNALCCLHMYLRDVCNRILYDKSFSAFHFPVMDEDAPNYRSIVQNPMDMTTLLQHVDSGKYMTCKSFLEDFYLIVANAKKYNGNDYDGARNVSRVYELQDAVHGMLSQMDQALVAFCEKIADEGGPMSLPNELGSSALRQTPAVHTTTHASACLRVQPDVNLGQSYGTLKRQKMHTETAQIDAALPKSSRECEAISLDHEMPNSLHIYGSQEESSDQCISEDVVMLDVEVIETVKQNFVERTDAYGIPQLERLYTRIMKGIFETKDVVKAKDIKSSILNFLLKFVEG